MKHLQRAFDGQNQWWKYLIVILVGFGGGQLLGVIPLGIVLTVVRQRNPELIIDADNILDFTSYGIDLNIGLILIAIPFIISLLLTVFLIKQLHKRNLKDTINGGTKIRWNKFFYGVFIWGILILTSTIIGYISDPKNYTVNFNLNTLIPLILVAVVFITIQSVYEEILFRGYLIQGLGVLTKNKWAAIIITSLVFGLLHSTNPEVKEYGFWLMMPNYVLTGIIFAIITILDDGIELAMGAHAVNNVLGSILITFDSSALQTNAILEAKTIDPQYGLIESILLGGIFIFLLHRKYRWDFQKLSNKIERVPSPE